MLTSMLWVVLVVGAAEDAAKFIDQIGNAVKSVQDFRAPPAIQPSAKESGLADAPGPAGKETRSQSYESSPGPVIQLETGRTPEALQ